MHFKLKYQKQIFYSNFIRIFPEFVGMFTLRICRIEVPKIENDFKWIIIFKSLFPFKWSGLHKF